MLRGENCPTLPRTGKRALRTALFLMSSPVLITTRMECNRNGDLEFVDVVAAARHVASKHGRPAIAHYSTFDA